MADDDKYTVYGLPGKEKLKLMIEHVYERVVDCSSLKLFYPDDLTEITRSQKQFMTQFFGASAFYIQKHQHPMFKAGHLPFDLTAHGGTWLSHRAQTLVNTRVEEFVGALMFERLSCSATDMIYRQDKTPSDEAGRGYNQ